MDVSLALDIKPRNSNNSSLIPQEKNFEGSSQTIIPKKSGFFFKSETRVKSPDRNFKANSLNLAINRLIYGCKVWKLFKSSFYHSTFFYINEENMRYLQWISPKKTYLNSRIDLLKIRLIHDTIKGLENINNSSKNEFLYIIYSNENAKKVKLTLKFGSIQIKELFWQGLMHYMGEARALNQFRPHYDMLASNFLTKKEPGEIMGLKNLRNFLKNRQIFIEIDELKSIFFKLKFDFSDSFTLNKTMLKQILRELMNDNELVDIFENYCDTWNRMNDKNEKTDHFMKISELKKFFIMEQGQVFDDESLREIIRTYEDFNIGDKPQDSISLSGFRNILFSIHNEFFNVDKLGVYQDMTHPLTDYYIKSSHNTYLSSNQIIGNSSVEAYIHALSHGYRCIELDCWDGDKGEPIIYHGYTLTSKIGFREVMRAIVDFGFIKNPYPIILSIENHCNKSQQKSLAMIIKETCKNSLYLLPEDHDEHEYFPSPEKLKHKILIKTKIPMKNNSIQVQDSSSLNSILAFNHSIGKFKNQQSIGSKFNITSFDKHSSSLKKSQIKGKNQSPIKNNRSEDLEDETTLQSSNDNYQEYTEQKNQNIELASKAGILGSLHVLMVKSVSVLQFLSLNQKSRSFMENINTISEENEEKICSASKNEEESNYLSSSPIANDHQEEPIISLSENLMTIFKTQKSEKFSKYSPNATKDLKTMITHRHSGDESKKIVYSKFNFSSIGCNVDFNKMHSLFYSCVSLLGIKMTFNDSSRSVFTISSLNEARILKYFSENESNIVDFHRKFLNRTYPSGTRIDSSNYDPIPSFFTGCQLVALNIQTCDVFLLMYEAMFRENGGLNSGYVLKPKFLRKDSKIIPSELKFVKKRLRIHVLSIQGISSITKSHNSGHYIEISLRGSIQDETENKVFRSETIKKKGGNGKFGLMAEFSMKCPEICFILIQVYGKNDVISDERLGWCCAMVYEENEDVRLAKIAKACKKIAEILPFDKKRYLILEQTDLITYFFLCVPLFGHSIDLLLKSMLDCLGTNETFILNFWKGIEYVSKNLIEKPFEKKLSTVTSARGSTVLMASVLEKLTNPKNAYLHLDFCGAIIENKPKIKWQALLFANKIMEMLFEAPKQNLIPGRINILDFFLTFLRNTNQENVIIKTCILIKDWKVKWPNLWHRSDFDIALEEVLLQKQDPNHKFEMVSEQASPFVPHIALHTQLTKPLETSEIIKFIEEGEKSESPKLKKPLIEIHQVKTHSSVEELVGADEWNDLKNGEEKFAEDDDENKNILIIQFENWLCTDEDPPLIGKNEYISHFFKIHDNFKQLLSLILDPLCNSPSNCWIKKYPKILKETEDSRNYKEMLQDNLCFRKKDHEPTKFSKFFNIFNLRSFRTLKMICDIRNYRHIYKANNTIVETYFACLYTVLLKDEGAINMNHIAKLTEYFIKRNQDLSINLIFNYNLLFKFMQYINLPIMRDFLLFFIGNFFHQTRLSIKNQNKLWKYMQNSYFFQDLAKAMLHGSITKLDLNKASDLFKAIDIEINIGTHETRPDESTENDPYNPSQALTSDNNTILEEFTGFRTDIDRLKDKLQVKSHVMAAKKLSNELMVIRSFKTVKKGDPGKEKKTEIDFGLGLAKKFLRKLETVRLTQYIEVPIPKEDQVMKTSFDSPLRSPNKSSQKAKSILLTRPPVKPIKTNRKKLTTISNNSSSNGSFIRTATLSKNNNSPLREKNEKILENSKNNSPLVKKKTNLMQKMASKKETISPFIKRGYLLEAKQKKDLQNSTYQVKDEQSIPSLTMELSPKNVKFDESHKNLMTSPSLKNLTLKGPSLKNLDMIHSQKNLVPIIEKKNMKKNLYPLSFKDLDETKLEIKSKLKKFSNELIEKTDKLFSLHAAELMSLIVKNAIENYDYPIMKKIIELNGKDYSLLFASLFQQKNGRFFKAILENYLIKIKVTLQNPVNSAFVCGETVNLILSRLSAFTLKPYFVPLHMICQKAFPFLCKLIIDSYNWEPVVNMEIKIQSLIVDDVMMSVRLLLVNTFYYIIKNDKEYSPKLMDSVPDACWHALLTWFFDKKHNNMYQRVFVNILEQCMKIASESFLVKILVKLNLIGSIYESMELVYQNEVPLMKFPVESFFFFIVKLIKMIENVLKNFNENKNFYKQVQGMSSWKCIMKICHKHFGTSFSPLRKEKNSPEKPGSLIKNQQRDSAVIDFFTKSPLEKSFDKPDENKSALKNSQMFCSEGSSSFSNPNPYFKIIDKQRKSKLIKMGSGDNVKLPNKYADPRIHNQEARTLIEIGDIMYLPKPPSNKKRNAGRKISITLDPISNNTFY